jgi:hypothetical protein
MELEVNLTNEIVKEFDKLKYCTESCKRKITKQSATPAWYSHPPRTCRTCNQQFTSNHDRACRYHPESYSGETAQRWLAPGLTEGGGKVHYFWTCCGDADEKHPGCIFQRHVTYDEEETFEFRRPGDGGDEYTL